MSLRTAAAVFAAIATVTGLAGAPAIADHTLSTPAAPAAAPDIDVAAVRAHLDALQQIADDNVDATFLDNMSDAMAYTLWSLAAPAAELDAAA